MNQQQSLLTLKDILIKHKVSRTRVREGIFLAALKFNKPISVSDLVKNVDADRASIYRNIQLFIKLNIFKVINIGWKNFYELGEMFKPHHHHLVCSGCTAVQSVEDSELENLLNLICDKRGFKLVEHLFEVRGLCKNCQN